MHMKTTVEIPDALLAAARKLAAKNGTTVRALIEEGLRRVVETRRAGGPFKLRDRSSASGGLRPEFRGRSMRAVSAVEREGRALELRRMLRSLPADSDAAEEIARRRRED